MIRTRRLIYTSLAVLVLAAITAMGPRESELFVCHSYAYCDGFDGGCQATVQNVRCYGQWMSGYCSSGC